VKEILRIRNFLRYFIADSVGKIADSYFFIFLAWLALEQTGSPAYAGALLMANAIPRLVLMLYGGVLADKIQPHVILRTGNLIQAAGIGLVFTWLLFGSIPIAGLFGLAIVFGVVDALSTPASMSAIPRIVPRRLLLQANSLVNGLEMGVFVAGSLLAGAVIQFGSIEFATAVNGLLYLLAAGLFFLVKMIFIDENKVDQRSEVSQIKDSLKYVWRRPVLRANTLLLAATNIAVSGPVTIGFLLIVTQKLNLGPIYYTVIFAMFGIGILIGSVSIGLRKNVKSPGRLIVINYLLNAIGLAAIVLTTNIWLIIATSFILGVIGGAANTISSTWIQLNTKKAMLGRVSAVTMLAAMAFDPISQGLSGLIAEWSIDGLFVLSGIFIAVSTLVVVAFNKVLLANEELSLNSNLKS
jgi:MFS family permease